MRYEPTAPPTPPPPGPTPASNRVPPVPLAFAPPLLLVPLAPPVPLGELVVPVVPLPPELPQAAIAAEVKTRSAAASRRQSMARYDTPTRAAAERRARGFPRQIGPIFGVRAAICAGGARYARVRPARRARDSRVT